MIIAFYSKMVTYLCVFLWIFKTYNFIKMKTMSVKWLMHQSPPHEHWNIPRQARSEKNSLLVFNVKQWRQVQVYEDRSSEHFNRMKWWVLNTFISSIRKLDKSSVGWDLYVDVKILKIEITKWCQVFFHLWKQGFVCSDWLSS